MKKSVKILLAASGILLAILLGLLLFYLIATAGAKLDPAKLALAESAVTVYDAEGGKLDAPAGERAPFSSFPAHLPNAFVAVEDKRFYSHGGLDPKRIAKAAFKNLSSFSFREGASTISQQLIKNTHLSGEKTLARKLKEIKLARALEKNYTKTEILELYLNSIYFGHSAFGITDAAGYYFGKSPSELSPAESATLAALVKSPNRYSPFKDPKVCLSRRNFVLSLMAEQGYLSPAEAERAKGEPLPAEPAPSKGESAYLSLVFEELSALFPETGPESGIRVYTDLDPALQSLLEETAADSDLTLLVRGREGGIRALHSTCGILKRLPASTVKPLAVYGPALEENLICPATPILDEETDFGGYRPSDYGGATGGYMSARYALAHSVNVPAVKLLNALGTGRASGYLERLGLPVPQEDRTLALALGGMSEGYTLPALADAYAAFSHGGIFSPSSAIARVEDGQGGVLYERKAAGKRVFSEDVACLMNDMLKTAAQEGTAKRLKGLPFEVCAKTGTGGGAAGNTDAYTIAYTTEDVVAVWLGNRDNSPVQATGGGAPASIARDLLAAIYASHAPAPFPMSEDVVEAGYDREEYENRHRLILSDPLAPDFLTPRELFRKSALPEGVSTKFSRPHIETPQIRVENGSVRIILCQTEYYDYVVKRQCGKEKTTIYSGKYRKELFDNSVSGGKTYVYTVIPFYAGIEGEAVTLPSVYIKKSPGIPDDWWMTEQERVKGRSLLC